MKFYGQFETPVDRFIFERYFPDVGIKGTFIECGAFDGSTECSCRFFEETMGWRGINLEPVPHIFDKLLTNRPGSENLNFGLSDRAASLNFQIVEHPRYGLDTTIGAIKHDPAYKQALLDEGCKFHDIEIQVISWSDLIARTGVEIIDLMVLDVEGHELSVLAGMKGHPILPHVMCVEFGHIGFDKLRATMDELGYDYDISSYANAFFVRRDKLTLFAHRAQASRESLRQQEQRRSALEEEVAALEETISTITRLKEEQISMLKRSTSWRVTAPLRAVKALFNKA
ncbi:FkbM family methyltransferase [Rhizobium grahamii]|uniref:FkbM family methyltransferase n=1 Tax=Rhizobium grahamii CCGE 502 TaxID=990285 RepID=S3HVB3_9HYPH|nr:FkbM family methyltransferase [Rhizobium grahamii]EPE97111.1 FkbM family methyltransferase [Rhizobium grahamii CCGE 502]